MVTLPALSLVDVLVGFRCTRACELIGLDYWEHQQLGKAFSVLADVITHQRMAEFMFPWGSGLMMVRSKRTPTRQRTRADLSQPTLPNARDRPCVTRPYTSVV